jgi:hypothetical protein
VKEWFWAFSAQNRDMEEIVKKLFFVLVFLMIALFAQTITVLADESPVDPIPQNAGGEYACSSRLQLRHPNLCQNIGPASRLADFARQGVVSNHPLPGERIDAKFIYTPYTYLRVGDGGAKLYASAQGAFQKKNAVRTLRNGFVFLSYIDRIESKGTVVYQIATNEFIRGDNVSRISATEFRGLTFTATPARSFAWVLANGNVYLTPDINASSGGRWISRYEIVQIYDRDGEIGSRWYMIGPDEWVPESYLAVVDPDPVRPTGIPSNRWITINLWEQTLTAYENGEMVQATLISSGLQGWWTRPGVFQVETELVRDHMSGAFEADRSDYYYLQDVPWVLYFDEARAIHGAYWHNGFGYPRSHGCVNLSPADAHWIYEWADEGTWIYVWDPSGTTPVDENLYGNGGV